MRRFFRATGINKKKPFEAVFLFSYQLISREMRSLICLVLLVGGEDAARQINDNNNTSTGAGVSFASAFGL